MTGFSSPNHTQTPNDLFDHLMREMTEAELKVVLAAIRKTLGYHRASDEISLTQFEKMTGLTRKGVIGGIQAALARGVLREVSRGKRGVVRYALVIESDQLPEVTSYHSTPELVTVPHQSQASTSVRSIHTKEKKTLKKEKKEINSAAHPVVEENGTVDEMQVPSSPVSGAPSSPKRGGAAHYGHYLALLACWNYDPQAVTNATRTMYMGVAKQLSDAAFPLEHITGLHAYVARKAKDGRWTSWTVNALAKYADEYRARLPKRPAQQLDEPEFTGSLTGVRHE